jgi:hypothetical protein
MIRTDATVCSSAAAGAAADMRARDIRSCAEANTFCKLVPGFPSSTESSKLQDLLASPEPALGACFDPGCAAFAVAEW